MSVSDSHDQVTCIIFSSSVVLSHGKRVSLAKEVARSKNEPFTPKNGLSTEDGKNLLLYYFFTFLQVL